jgi:hypothetical protein
VVFKNGITFSQFQISLLPFHMEDRCIFVQGEELSICDQDNLGLTPSLQFNSSTALNKSLNFCDPLFPPVIKSRKIAPDSFQGFFWRLGIMIYIRLS